MGTSGEGSRRISVVNVLTQSTSFAASVFGSERTTDVGRWLRGWIVPAVNKGTASYIGLTVQVKDSTGTWRGVAASYSPAPIYGVMALAPLQVTAAGIWLLSSTSGGAFARFMLPNSWRLRAVPSGGIATSITVDALFESEFEA